MTPNALHHKTSTICGDTLAHLFHRRVSPFLKIRYNIAENYPHLRDSYRSSSPSSLHGSRVIEYTFTAQSTFGNEHRMNIYGIIGRYAIVMTTRIDTFIRPDLSFITHFI